MLNNATTGADRKKTWKKPEIVQKPAGMEVTAYVSSTL